MLWTDGRTTTLVLSCGDVIMVVEVGVVGVPIPLSLLLHSSAPVALPGNLLSIEVFHMQTRNIYDTLIE